MHTPNAPAMASVRLLRLKVDFGVNHGRPLFCTRHRSKWELPKIYWKISLNENMETKKNGDNRPSTRSFCAVFNSKSSFKSIDSCQLCNEFGVPIISVFQQNSDRSFSYISLQSNYDSRQPHGSIFHRSQKILHLLKVVHWSTFWFLLTNQYVSLSVWGAGKCILIDLWTKRTILIFKLVI